MKARGSKRQRHHRESTNVGDRLFIHGLNGVLECLRSPHVQLVQLWIESDTPQAWFEQHQVPDPGIQVTRAKGGRTTFGPLTQGVAALVNRPDWGGVFDGFLAQQSGIILALDQVEDPVNLGQIMRTCEGAGVDGILVPGRRAAPLNQTSAQMSQGAFAWLPVCDIGNLRGALDQLRLAGYWIIGAEYDDTAKPWFRVDYRRPVCLVLGSEGRGLRRLTRESCDELAFLPMHGRLTSLNVAAATSAFLYEIRRQRASDRIN